MFYTICLSISFCLFLLGIGMAILQKKKYHASPNQIIAFLMGGTSAALFPLYIIAHASDQGGFINAFLLSILGAIHSLTGAYTIFDLTNNITSIPQHLETTIFVYISFLHVFATVLLLGFLLSLLQEFFPRLWYHFFARGHLCLFSDISERSLFLAQDIRDREKQGHPRAVLVFLGSRKNAEGAAELWESLHRLNAFVFDTSLENPMLYKNFQGQRIDIFLLHLDEQENLRAMLRFDEKYKTPTGHDFFIHILNSQREAETVVDSVETTAHIHLRLIRENRSIFYNLFTTRPLFLGARQGQLSVLVVGAGRNGLEAVKTAYWCGQTLHLRPKILVVDSNPAVKDQLEYECPELGEHASTLQIQEEGTVQFVSMDVNSTAFLHFLKAHADIGYVVCALGNDTLNIQTAMTIRSVFEEIRFTFAAQEETSFGLPLINVLLNNHLLSDVGDKLKFDTRVGCKLHAFGSLQEMYTWENIVSPYFDHVGMAFNRFYARHYAQDALAQGTTTLAQVDSEADNKYEDKEYNRTASMSLGIHAKYKMYACLCEALNKKCLAEEWTGHITHDMLSQMEQALSCPQQGPELVEKMAEMEHRRWNTYTRSLGWQCATTAQVEMWHDTLHNYRNFAAKLHPCLIPWADLPLLDAWFMEKYQQKTDFQELDRIMVCAMPKVLQEAIAHYQHVPTP